MKQSEPVIHIDPEIMGARLSSSAREYRSRRCSTTYKAASLYLSSWKTSPRLHRNRLSRR